MVGLIDIKYFYLQVKMNKMIPELYNQFAAPLGHGSGTLILKIVKEIFLFFFILIRNGHPYLLSSLGLKMIKKNYQLFSSITSLNFNYVKPCLDLVQL